LCDEIFTMNHVPTSTTSWRHAWKYFTGSNSGKRSAKIVKTTGPSVDGSVVL